MFLEKPIVQMLMMRGLKYGLKRLREYMSTDDFVLTVDQVLDRVEDYFKQDSFKDQMVEEVCKELRDYFQIPDND